ncbi:unnamed protein product [Kluyveromyces dobzhanskii CBS 2104]|uniref:ATP-dependent RNA helicase n=1 Tax=Kluyveromyces dobzhanskii CBS 2104 TaxID=1427455 RepID=A0A0A8LBV0_9SACH|nr:unnamed protein product [Kluyveromyces dobzhanskii CBS 2104]
MQSDEMRCDAIIKTKAVSGARKQQPIDRMFAARFDPTKIATNATETAAPPVKEFALPQKRRRETKSDETGDEGTSDQESDEESDKESDEQLDDAVETHGETSENEANQSETSEQPLDTRHSSVLNRFQQTLSLQDALSSSDKVERNTEEEDKDVSSKDVHSLTPIPQPARVTDRSMRLLDPSTYKSTAWDTATKIHYSSTMIKDFNHYKQDLDERLIKNIISDFSAETFPIQTILFDTVLPLLNSSFSANKKRFTRQVGDILVNASTGSGKTLAYAVPLVQILRNRTVNRVRAIILVPTKILIHQVYDCLSKISQGTSLSISMSKLENSLKEEHNKFLHNCPDILIITPGRLVDHLQMNSFDLKSLKFLVLDEADRLLNQSFQNWNQVLFHHLAEDKQDKRPGNVIKMVFSATLTTNAEKLYNLHLHNPKIFLTDSVKLYSLPKKLQELNVNIPTAKSLFKPLLLLKILHDIKTSSSNSKILVFVKSNEASIRLGSLLQAMLKLKLIDSDDSMFLSSIHSNISKGSNRKLIHEFASSEDMKSVLISTDIMSRGIDITEITHVINYDLPISSQQYVHRCGRTARATTEGVAINLLVGKGEQRFWSSHLDTDLSRDVDGYQPSAYLEDEKLSQLLHIESHLQDRYKNCIKELQSNNEEGIK